MKSFAAYLMGYGIGGGMMTQSEVGLVMCGIVTLIGAIVFFCLPKGPSQ